VFHVDTLVKELTKEVDSLPKSVLEAVKNWM
jgi:hypothetical protein